MYYIIFMCILKIKEINFIHVNTQKKYNKFLNMREYLSDVNRYFITEFG